MADATGLVAAAMTATGAAATMAKGTTAATAAEATAAEATAAAVVREHPVPPFRRRGLSALAGPVHAGRGPTGAPTAARLAAGMAAVPPGAANGVPSRGGG
jgi:hypothetical protein